MKTILLTYSVFVTEDGEIATGFCTLSDEKDIKEFFQTLQRVFEEYVKEYPARLFSIVIDTEEEQQTEIQES